MFLGDRRWLRLGWPARPLWFGQMKLYNPSLTRAIYLRSFGISLKLYVLFIYLLTCLAYVIISPTARWDNFPAEALYQAVLVDGLDVARMMNGNVMMLFVSRLMKSLTTEGTYMIRESKEREHGQQVHISSSLLQQIPSALNTFESTASFVTCRWQYYVIQCERTFMLQ